MFKIHCSIFARLSAVGGNGILSGRDGNSRLRQPQSAKFDKVFVDLTGDITEKSRFGYPSGNIPSSVWAFADKKKPLTVLHM